jgi:hypothetical protein
VDPTEPETTSDGRMIATRHYRFRKVIGELVYVEVETVGEKIEKMKFLEPLKL